MTAYAFPITIVVQADGTTTVTGATLPVNTTLPTSTGTPQVGVPFTFTRGVWSNSPTSYTEQVNAAGVAIGGATSLTYTPVAGDLGKVLTITENAANGAGTGTAVTSAATPAVAAAPSYFAWSTTDKGTAVTVSNSGHTATHTTTTNGNQGVRGTVSKTTGKWHFEVKADLIRVAGVGNCGVGIANATLNLTSGWPGGDANSIAWYDDGAVFKNGAQVATWASYVTGNVLAIEFDADAKTIKGKVGAGAYSTAVSYSTITGAVFPVCGPFANTEAFSAVPSTLTVTSGFTVLV